MRALVFALVLASCTRSQPAPPIRTPAPPPAPPPPPAIVIDSAEDEPDCFAFRAALPGGITEGFVDVPEDATAPDGPHVRVYYYGRWKQPAAVPPILIINGGPSYASHGYYESLIGELDRRQLPFVFFDQRGTGCSTPYPAWSSENAPRFAHYSSSEIVDDAEAIRAAIGAPRWRVFGHSFGARVALRYVAKHPSALEQVFIAGDSVGNVGMATVYKVRDTIETSRAVLAEFLAQRPQARATLAWLRKTIPADRCYTDRAGLVRVCGFAVITPLAHGFDEDKFDDLADTVEYFRDGDKLDLDVLDGAARRIAWRYVDPAKVIISAQDYTMFVGDRSVCSLAEELVAREPPPRGPIPASELFDSCVIRRALDALPVELVGRPRILRLRDVGAGLRINRSLHVREFQGGHDTLTSGGTSLAPASSDNDALGSDVEDRWTTVIIDDATHGALLDAPALWDRLAAP